MKRAPNPREVIGSKRFKCDTKQGKKCEPMAGQGWMGNYVKCKHCNKAMRKP